MKEKTRFGALGAVLAAAGSAVGLGNIWKFPYMTGENGGGAFLLIYLACILLFGIPILSAEFYAGRRGYGRWRWLEPVALLSATLFCGFYFVITGWCFHYLILSVTGATSALSPAALSEVFGGVTGEVLMPCFCIVLAVLITAFITVAGIKSGIERASKILMPLLFIILIALIIYGLTLPGNREGLRFLFAPDFSKITPTLTINALSQCFFTLSLGMAVMANYASFMEPSQNLTRTAMQVAGLDTIVAILAGLAIFPAVFSLGIDPTQGPELVFVTLPSAFNHIAGGYWLQILFFLLMVIAAITTTISIVQTQEYWLETHTRLSRRWATCIAALIDFLLALLCSLSLSSCCTDYLTIAGMSLYDAADWLVSKILFPAGGILFSLYVGWICEPADVVKELSIGGRRAIGKTLLMLIRYVIPVVLILIVIFGFLA